MYVIGLGVFAVLWKHVIKFQIWAQWTELFQSNMKNVQKFKIQNQYQLLKSWTLSFCDNITGHTLATLEKGRRVSVLYNQKAGGLACMLALCSHLWSHVACVFAHVHHMGCLLGVSKSANLWNFGKKGRYVAQLLLKQNHVRCIPTNNWTFHLGIVLDYCAVHICANDIMLTDGFVICSSISY